jgi:amino acid transporter
MFTNSPRPLSRTGYDTSAHVAEETSNSHNSAPMSMLGSVINCLFLGEKSV